MWDICGCLFVSFQKHYKKNNKKKSWEPGNSQFKEEHRAEGQMQTRVGRGERGRIREVMGVYEAWSPSQSRLAASRRCDRL